MQTDRLRTIWSAHSNTAIAYCNALGCPKYAHDESRSGNQDDSTPVDWGEALPVAEPRF